MTRQTTPAELEPALLSLPEAAAILGKSVSQLEWMIYTGSAPKYAKVGGRRMFRRRDIEAFIADAFNEATS